LRVAAGALAFVAALGVTFAIDAAVVAVQPADPSWVWAELQLWLEAPLVLIAAWLVARRERADRQPGHATTSSPSASASASPSASMRS
jgi:hypothetical protein